MSDFEGHVRRTWWLVLLLVMVAAGCTSDERVRVEVAAVGAGEVVRTVAAGGVLRPAGQVTVAAPAGGEVTELLVADGDHVRAGDPLARLASPAVEQQLTQAEAALDTADALVASAGATGADPSMLLGPVSAQLEAIFPPLIGGLEGQVAVLEAALERASTREEQLARVIGELEPERFGVELPAPTRDTEPQTALDDTRRQLSEAEARYAEAQQELARSQSTLSSQAQDATEARVAAAEAQREQAELALQAARQRQEALLVEAPVDGTVELARGGAAATSSSLDGLGDLGGLGDVAGLPGGAAGGPDRSPSGPIASGAAVTGGQPLLSLVDLSQFSAEVDVDELDVVHVAAGDTATVRIDALPDQTFAGTVSHVAVSPDRPAGGGAVFPVTVELGEEPADLARIGLTASVEIEVDRLEAGTVVPSTALLRRGETDDEVVYVVRDDTAVEVPVRVELIGDELAAVDGDLAAGDRVVAAGVELVGDGTPVEVVE